MESKLSVLFPSISQTLQNRFQSQVTLWNTLIRKAQKFPLGEDFDHVTANISELPHGGLAVIAMTISNMNLIPGVSLLSMTLAVEKRDPGN